MRIASWVLGVAVVLGAGAAAAQSNNAYYMGQRGMNESFRIDIGGFFQTFDTTVRIGDANGSDGTPVNVEDVLGASSHQTNIFANGYWRFGRHASLQFAYRHASRDSENAISKDFSFGDNTFHAGATLDTHFAFDLGELYYSYSFVNNGDMEFALMLGISAYFTRSQISLAASVSGSGGSASGSVQSEDRNVVAPIPALGAYMRYTLYPRFFVYGKIRGLTATISGYHGSMLSYSAGLDYYFTNNFGIGGGYEYTKIVFEKTETRKVGLDFKYNGPVAYVTLAF